MTLSRKTTGLVVAAALLAGCAPAPERWGDNERRGPWHVVFTGHGTVSGDDDELMLEPTAASSADRTHAALVVTRVDFPPDTSFSMVVRTERHTRHGDPNPWEVGWVLWNYQDNDHFYAVALKPNGWEVSKQDPAYPGKQRFLISGHEPTFPIGRDYRVEVIQSGASVAVRADGHLLGEFTDTEQPYTHGAIGAYTEDARVRFSGLTVEQLSADQLSTGQLSTGQLSTDQIEGRPASSRSAHEQGTGT